MTCCEGFTSCNGFFLMALSILAICLNLLPLVINYAMDSNLFVNAISCYEWWLPGVIGGGILVLPAVAMSLAAKKGGSCNSRTGMLMSAVLCLPSIIGAIYCVLISLYALGKGPLICEKGSGASLSSCDFTISNISSLANLNLNLDWYLNNDSCDGVSLPPDSETNSTLLNLAENLNIDLDTANLKNYHLVTFAGLSVIGLLEIIVSALQIVAGAFGCLCGTSKRRRGQPM
ncbi:transmembrane 4 L6 family member 20-like [Huso huso]|uniref:Transmembrane 4 L6 family member 20-like n=1 Tax=Huso huso TaxID=61971 RepID=A0ABR0Z1D3_HUSHU